MSNPNWYNILDAKNATQNLEDFVRWFLRLNGYFGIESFIVHAGGDTSRISDGMVGSPTEVDTLAIRMPYSTEVTGTLKIANYPPLVEASDRRVDIVIAETKSGQNTPNAIWKHQSPSAAIEYLVRFIGIFSSESKIAKVASELARTYRYEDKKCRFRYIVFAKSTNRHYSSQGVSYIEFKDLVKFLVEVRGQCWLQSNIGVASLHDQWNKQICGILKIANNQQETLETRTKQAVDYFYKEFALLK